MLPTSQIQRLLQSLPPQLLDIVLEMRNLIALVASQATETRHSKGFTYYDKQRGGPVSGGICQISIYPDHARLEFIHGVFLNDPCGLLEVEGKRKYKRFVRIYSYENTPWDALKELIHQSSNFDPYSAEAKTLARP
jgi:hypothetical protein